MEIKAEKPIACLRSPRIAARSKSKDSPLVLGLINNMPDSALEATEAQFSKLLGAAAGDREVRLRLSYLPEVARGREAQTYLVGNYWTLEALQHEPPDALIVTGAEPLAVEINQEPYWQRFTEVLEWADRNTVSSIWSCLAAHAAVQHLSGIQRQRFSEKCCGVFEHSLLEGHWLNKAVPAPFLIPHSRWNNLPLDRLRQAGYAIASESSLVGANVFTLQRNSALVFLQGHPEYETGTLLREYRRDISRFLSGVQTHYPNLPLGYFSQAAIQRLNKFRERAVTHPSTDLISKFPFESELHELKHTWGNGSTVLYENWLSLIAARRGDAQKSSRVL